MAYILIYISCLPYTYMDVCQPVFYNYRWKFSPISSCILLAKFFLSHNFFPVHINDYIEDILWPPKFYSTKLEDTRVAGLAKFLAIPSMKSYRSLGIMRSIAFQVTVLVWLGGRGKDLAMHGLLFSWGQCKRLLLKMHWHVIFSPLLNN